MNDLRKNTFRILLSKKLSKEDVKRIEAVIHSKSSCQEEYAQLVYEHIDSLIDQTEAKVKTLKLPKSVFDSNVFADYKKQEDKLFTEIASGPVVKEGIEPCRRCKNKKVTSYQLQTRSGDEGMTTYYTCISCGYKWKTG